MNSPLSSNSWIGRLIGDNQRYRLDKGLGGGGMGEVFLATDTRVGKEVALKLLRDKWLGSGEMRKRFEREIAICAALQSDNIIEISDCGVTDEGFPFYVMEYLQGQTLRYLMLREKQLSPERTVKIMTQVCKGLQVAHQGVVMQRDGKNSSDRIKVIHRDLKPDNIFLLPREFGEWVKILDFGIAKIKDDSSGQITNLTKTFIGTFRYSSPEQIQNDQNIDARADIYSLGVILYEMLSAADPFGLSIDGSRVSESSWLHAHGYRPPIPLKQQPGCQHLSSELEAVVLKCLQKKPSNRFASVEELGQALQAAIQPVVGRTIVQQRQVIVQPQLQQPQLGSNDETVAKPQQPLEQNKLQLGSNDETVSKPQQAGLESQSEIANSQPPPSLDQSLNQANQNQPNRLENKLFQQPPILNQPQGQTPEGTIVQYPASNRQQQTPDNTIFQIRTSTGAEPPTADKTIYQRQPNYSNKVTPEKTIYQPRSNYPPNAQQKPENTIYQPRIKNVQPQKNNLNLSRILSIALVIGLLLSLAVISYLVYSRQEVPNKEVPQR
ncbi:serine/threonine protein kinase [Nostoc sphaeroides]|uniref:PrkC, eukaryotic serine/threonine-protein kinase n=1 Tax=Nostoc sphaeroides CCNUC1 TaxID=2653204 RepID=A0A5P8WEH6_9NOSO|nr:serine/threonine-protein kinase [Nostoc sphaeroides]QFS50299.1 prkC, eukaryotic serine/threonine-protein kinase [Nostoc sphaeroides CCNUC1]